MKYALTGVRAWVGRLLRDAVDTVVRELLCVRCSLKELSSASILSTSKG